MTTGSEAADSALTVGGLLGAALEVRLEKQEDLEGDPEAWVGALRETLEQALPTGAPEGDVRRIFVMLREALDIPIPDVLIAAWQRYEPFRKYVDPVKYPPGTESEVPLGKHVARASLEPEVEVLVNGKVLATLRFETELTLTLEGAVVLVRDGRFMSTRTGDCSVQVEVCFEGKKLAEVGPEKERIPGRISFGKGVPIDPFGKDPYTTPEG